MSKAGLFVIVVSILIGVVVIGLFNGNQRPEDARDIGSAPSIFPDYSGVVFPRNISPANFLIENPADRYYVEISSSVNNSPVIEIYSSDASIVIPDGKWKSLIQLDGVDEIFIDVYAKRPDERWTKYKTIVNTISDDPVDPYIAYRKILPTGLIWRQMGLYQRDVETFRETAILKNSMTNNNCMSCHSFCNNSPDTMMFHLRKNPGGTIIYKDNKAELVDTATSSTVAAATYPMWHPSGRLIAFSLNKPSQLFRSLRNQSIFVFDLASDIALYDVEKKILTSSPKVSGNRLENLPAWSHDGKTIYFISAAMPTTKSDLRRVRYDLMKVPYDIDKNIWGDVETVISSDKVDKSISFPRASPDGRFLSMVMADYGYFTIFNPTSDVYLMDLKTGKHKKIEGNSDHVESYPVWSSNSRWLMFVSKRDDAILSRVYMCHVAEDGTVSKPFMLPQENPEFHCYYRGNYNRPEFVTGKVKYGPRQFRDAAFSEPHPVEADQKIKDIAASRMKPE